MLAAAAGQAPFQPNYSYYNPRSGAPANWQAGPIRGASRDDQPYNPQQAYYGYSPERDPTMEDDIAWAKLNREKNTPQDYFDRIAINGRTYSVPNQMLDFASDYPWETTSWWYEPPANLAPTPEWKQWRGDGEGAGSTKEVLDPADTADGGGGWGGGGWGGGGYGFDSSYSAGFYGNNWGNGYGSGNYSSKPAYPEQGYRQDPNIYYQQLVKWVI